MRQGFAALIAVCASVATACSFTVNATGGDDGDTSTISASFVDAASLEDEASGTIMVPVRLSEASDQMVTVSFEIVDGSATANIDYFGTDGALTFSPGELEQTIGVQIIDDGVEEQNETFAINLTMASGASLGTRTHTVTINANVLPRVSVSVIAAAASLEDVTPTLVFTLDKPSPVATSVTYTLGGNATAEDYALTAGTVAFAAGSTMEMLPLGVIDDDLDEDDENVVVTLGATSGIIVGAMGSQTYQILDNDASPTVQFTLASSQVRENMTRVDLMVELSAISGRTVTVPFSIDNASTATATADYTPFTISPLTFTPPATTIVLSIDVLEDTAIEPDETIVVRLGMPQNATPGTNVTHTLTIRDDDQSCLGEGSYAACVPTPTAAQTLPLGTINTDTSPLCASAQPMSGWTGQPAACFIIGTTITANSATLVTGSRPLVLWATESITVPGILDASSHRGLNTVGPGAPSAVCTAGTTPQRQSSGGGGGAGGSFLTRGGPGGDGNGGGTNGGTAPTAASAPAVLRAGCSGQTGGSGTDSGPTNAGAPGAGGGVVYLVSGGPITITGVVSASGGGGTGGGNYSGGSGGGSGGMIKLHGTAIDVTNGVVMANGGGGSSGGDNDSNGNNGGEPSSSNPTNAAAGGANSGGVAGGGAGNVGPLDGGPGANGNSNDGGGGGGGGGGYIQANLAIIGGVVTAGLVDAP